MALVLTIVLMMEPDGVKEEIVVKVRDYTNVFRPMVITDGLRDYLTGVGYWLRMLWSVFTIFLEAWGLFAARKFSQAM